MLEKDLQKQKIKIDYVPIEKINPSAYNPRKISSKQEEDLTISIQKFNLVDPFIVNGHKGREFNLVGGHQRYKICQKLGYKEVPVVWVDLNEAKERELNLRLNANTGEWDFEMLKDFKVELLLDVGFTDTELSDIWDDVLGVDNDDFDIEKNLKEAEKTQIKTGDLFKLGDHYLLCQDSTYSDNVQKLVGNNKMDMIDVDCPYNIGLDYNKGIGGKNNYGGEVNDKKSKEEYKEFVWQLINRGLSAGKKDLHVFFWCDEKYVGMLQELYELAGIKEKRTCLWIKDNQNPTPQIAFSKVTEFCLYGSVGNPYLSDKIKNLNEVLNKEVATGNRLQDDILDLLNIWLVKRLPATEYFHPTSKPPALYEKALRRCTKPGDAVLDLCAGSGSILIACEQLKRRAFLCEISPVFTQLIINRYEKFSNNKAQKIN
ncbi:MAG: DNA modification methylase [Candidatus Parcubacteria bacterium]|nr:DNA modification methylase [Candidatus Parcubacteria bacterium]